jgi:hypothetical protein
MPGSGSCVFCEIGSAAGGEDEFIAQVEEVAEAGSMAWEIEGEGPTRAWEREHAR